MLPIFFVVPHRIVTTKASGDVHNYLQILTKNRNSRWTWQLSWTTAAQNWRGLTITKLTQTTDTLQQIKNRPQQKLQQPVTAADLQIRLFFNCRPH